MVGRHKGDLVHKSDLGAAEDQGFKGISTLRMNSRESWGTLISLLESVVKYIQNQGSYHKKVSFQQEYIALLKKHGVEYDPRYVFG